MNVTGVCCEYVRLDSTGCGYGREMGLYEHGSGAH